LIQRRPLGTRASELRNAESRELHQKHCPLIDDGDTLESLRAKRLIASSRFEEIARLSCLDGENTENTENTENERAFVHLTTPCDTSTDSVSQSGPEVL